MYVRSFEAGQDNNLKIKGDIESGGKRKVIPGKEVEVVWTCDEKRGVLRRKEGNECIKEMEDRKAKEKMAGQSGDDIKEKAIRVFHQYTFARSAIYGSADDVLTST